MKKGASRKKMRMFEAGFKMITIKGEITVICSSFQAEADTMSLKLAVVTPSSALEIFEIQWNKKTKIFTAKEEDKDALNGAVASIQRAKLIGRVTRALELAHLAATLQEEGVVFAFSEEEEEEEIQGEILEESEETTKLDHDNEKINELRRSLTLRKGEEKWEDKFARQRPKDSL